MSRKYVRLVGSAFRYNLEGSTYEAGKVYAVPEARAEALIRKVDHANMPFFAILTNSQVEELTGERVQPTPEPEPAKPEKAELVVSDETEEEAAKKVAEEQQKAEDAALDAEADITDSEVEVVGEPAKPLEAELVVEDGTTVEDANSYVTVEEVDDLPKGTFTDI